MVKAAQKYDFDKLLRLIPGYDPWLMADGFHFDEKLATKALDFFPIYLTHVKGEKGGKPFDLEPWQQAIVACIFGFVDSAGLRRYRHVLLYVPRKNGKTPFCAGILLLILYCDGEPGAEIYCAAADRDQAALAFAHAKGMVEQNPRLQKHVTVFKTSKCVELAKLHSTLKVISAEANTKHGYNSHAVLVDELHAQKDRELVDVLRTSFGARRQPLEIDATTADFWRPESICNETLAYAKRVRDNKGDPAAPGYDPRCLPVIFEAMKEDDWKSEDVWRRVNPNLGVSISLDYMRGEFKRAIESPSFENTFKRFHLNMQTEQAERWIQMDAWNACGGALKPLAGRTCIGALDLSSTRDLSALVLLFPDGGEYDILPFFWCPKDRAHERELRDRVPYETWAKQGRIELTPGNVIDYDWIKDRLGKLRSQHNICEIAFDPWNATQTVLQLQADGFKMVEFPQSFKTMNDPCKQVEKLMIEKKLRHGGHPVLKWMASNVAARRDPAGNIKLDKEKSFERIDGIVALVMALGRAQGGAVKPASVYETRGLATVG